MTEMDEEIVYQWLADVTDPEVPVLSILDLGIVREVLVKKVDDEPAVTVFITPTYSGCPAMDVIAMGIRMALLSHGVRRITIEPRLSPA